MSEITTPHDNDVLCGRGGGTLKHIGNHNYRQLVSLYRAKYVTSKKSDKMEISRGIVSAIREQDPPGHFLEQDTVTGLWNEIGDKRAIEKTSQALREGQPNLRKKIIDPSRRSSTCSSSSSLSRRGSIESGSWSRRGSIESGSWSRRGSIESSSWSRRGSIESSSWSRRGSIECGSWSRRGSIETVSTVATSFSRRGSTCSNVSTVAPFTQTSAVPGVISTPTIDGFSQSQGFSAFARSSATSSMILKHIELNQPDDIRNDTRKSVSSDMLDNDLQSIDSIDQEINDLICENFANLDNNDFDDAVAKIIENTPDNTAAHYNDTNSIKFQMSDLEPLNCDQPQIIDDTYKKLAESVCALSQEELYACMSVKADNEKEDNATCLNSITSADTKKAQKQNSSRRFFGNRAA